MQTLESMLFHDNTWYWVQNALGSFSPLYYTMGKWKFACTRITTEQLIELLGGTMFVEEMIPPKIPG